MWHGQAAQIVKQLTRIADALEKQLDLTDEDATVKQMMRDTIQAQKDLANAQGHLPPRPTTKGTN